MASPTPSTGSDRTVSLTSLNENEYHSLSSAAHSPLTSSPASLSSSSNSTTNVDNSSSILVNGHSNSVSSSQCGICHGTFINPKVLPCFHTFCQACLERNQEHPDKITCSRCQQECVLSSRGITGLLPDFTVKECQNGLLADELIGAGGSHCCTGCKNLSASAIVHCVDCNHYLCQDCMVAHQLLNLEGHRIYNLSSDGLDLKDESKYLASGNGGNAGNDGEKMVPCPRHKTDYLKYFCVTCNVPICKECTVLDHPSGLHNFESLNDVGIEQLERINKAVQDSKKKASDIRGIIKNLDHSSNKLQVQFHKAQNEVNDTFLFYRSMLEERKQEILKELESVFSTKQLSINVVGQKAQETVDKIYQTCEFIDRLMKYASVTECLLFKKLLDSKLQSLMSYTPEISLQNAADLEFVSNYQAIQVGVRNTFGYVRSSGEVNVGPAKQPPIARPTIMPYSNGTGTSLRCASDDLPPTSVHSASNGTNGVSPFFGSRNGPWDRPYTNGLSGGDIIPDGYDLITPTSGGGGPNKMRNGVDMGIFGSIADSNSILSPSYGKWSPRGAEIFQSPEDPAQEQKILSASMFPPKSQIKRQKMIYHCKFGEFGALEGQFTEPSGVAVNAHNDIIVADTNNHRIQIFDKEGRFKFQFGECGKRDGQLLYPNRVAVVKHTGDIIVTERSPTHQIQIYNQYGQFLRKFGATILQHPRGITVDNKGRIVVVECKVMRVIIFDQMGTVLQKFGCSKHLEFPNGVVVNDYQEIFISDNRAHCVKVFNYEGVFLRQIGSEGITNYPIGVGINAAGEILIADNHNNFNLTIFTQDGQLVSALESKVKHAQCFDVALMDDGSVVLASKDYRLYIYRYIQIPPIGI